MIPMNSPADTLDLMDSFNYIKLLPKKSGQMVFLCTCADAYQSYCCVESVLLSLLSNPELEVADIARLKQLNERERAARANPFTATTFGALAQTGRYETMVANPARVPRYVASHL